MSSHTLQKTNAQVVFRLGPVVITPKMLQKVTPYLFLAPAVLILCLAMLFPVFYGLRLGFYDWTLRDMAAADNPKLVEESFEQLAQANLPEDILKKIEKLKNRKFTGREKFIEKLESTIGMEETQKYRAIILDAALKKPTFLGLGNYLELLKSEFFRTSVKVTLKFTLGVLVLELILGLLLALLLEEKMKGVRLFRTLFILPIMVAPVVVGLTWRFLYDPSFGLINYLLGFVGIEPQTWLANPNLALPAVIMTDVWQWTPFVFLLLLAGLQGIPRDLLEAGQVDGTNYLQNLFYIKLPQIKSIIAITAVLRLIDAFRSLEVMFIMTEGGPGMSTEIMSLHIYKTAFTSQRLGLASAIAVVLLSLILGLTLIMLVSTRSKKEVR